MIRREITTRLKSVLVWALGFAFMIIGGMTKFDAFKSGSVNQLNEFIQAMPKIIRIIYGLENVDVGSFDGYFRLIMLYVFIMVAIQGTFLGTSLIHREFKDRTADFLFVKPMSRDRILAHKIFAGLSIILILDGVIALSSLYIFSQTGHLSHFPETILATFSTHLFFFSLGFLLTVLLAKTKYGQQLGLIVILGSYLSISLSQLYNQAWLSNISPIGWYNGHLFNSSALEISLALLLICLLSFIFLGLGVYRFRSKDIPN